MRSTLDQRIAALVEATATIEDWLTATVENSLDLITFEDARGNTWTLRKAAETLLADRDRRYRFGEGSILAWNVKCHTYDETGKSGENKVNDALDAAWLNYMSKHDSDVFYRAVEQAQEYYRADWCSYPGNDQGDWRFHFAGRSGGWLALESWRGHDISKMDEDSYIEFVATLIYDAMNRKAEPLAAFLGGICDADKEFTSDAANENVSVYINDARAAWEADRENIAVEIAQAVTRAAKKEADKYGLKFDDSDLLLQITNEAGAKLAEIAA